MVGSLNEYESVLENYEKQIGEYEQKEREISQERGATLFGTEYQENLVRWQLDIKEELKRIEQLLRKRIPKYNQDGQEYFIDPKEEDQLFNEHGINFILNLLGWYLNKNFILSNFDEEQINMRVHQFSTELTNYIHNNYQTMGLDTIDKLKEVNMVIMNLVNTIEATYNRALGGGERESLRTARTVHQTEPLGGYQGQNQVQPSSKKTSFLNPMTWGRK